MINYLERSQIPFLNLLPNYISELISRYTSYIPVNIQKFLPKAFYICNILIGSVILYIPFVYVFQRDYEPIHEMYQSY
ncbi:hypothetical protein G9O61_00g014600 [Vairimorpha ceranae]|nr:hypothetical protein G9O61_00g014600 [Vairimorpha ceranae]